MSADAIGRLMNTLEINYQQMLDLSPHIPRDVKVNHHAAIPALGIRDVLDLAGFRADELDAGCQGRRPPRAEACE